MRYLPLISDRDRLAAAVYAAEKICRRLNIIANRRKLLWVSYVDSSGKIVSVSS